MVELAAIVSSFNRLGLLQRALPSLLGALRDCPWESSIVVFDAGSTDGSREWLEALAAQERSVSVLKPSSGDDTSFSGGVNAACALALKQNSALKWLLFFETDNWLAGATPLKGAADLLQHEPHGCPFPGVFQFIIGQQLSNVLRMDRPLAKNAQISNGLRWWLCDVVYTSPLLVRREDWEQSGGFDATAFPFSETDLDWAWRLQKRGRLQAVIETPDVVHDNRGHLSVWSVQRTLRFHHARLLLLRRHRGWIASAAEPLLFLRHLCETAVILALWWRLDDPRQALDKRQALLRGVFRDYHETNHPT
jgi:GT2 family glycosyltransferase